MLYAYAYTCGGSVELGLPEAGSAVEDEAGGDGVDVAGEDRHGRGAEHGQQAAGKAVG